MMHLDDLLPVPPPHETLRGLWVVLDAAQADTLLAAQDDRAPHRVGIVALTDGTFALCADVLTETGEGGIFAHLAPVLASLGPCEVVERAVLASRLPETPSE